jgi:hypothetical protein
MMFWSSEAQGFKSLGVFCDAIRLCILPRMSELPPTSHAPSPVHQSNLGRRPAPVKIGGSLGIAGVFISMAVFLAGVFGFDAAAILAPLALALAFIGLVVTIFAGVMYKSVGNDEMQPLAAFFVCIIGIVAALLEIYMMTAMFAGAPKG